MRALAIALVLFAVVLFARTSAEGLARAGDDAEQAAAEAANPVFDELLTAGVPLGDGSRLRLAPPTLADGLDPAAQRAVLETIADAHHPLDQLLRPSVVAPFVLKIGRRDAGGQGQTIRTLDLWFVAHGVLEAIYQRKFLEDFTRLSASGANDAIPVSGHVLEEPEIAARMLLEGPPPAETYWFHGQFGLFDRVHISATRHATASRTADSIVLASILDERFVGDEQFPNQWRPARRNALGEIELGEPVAYRAAGFYAKVTRLAEPSGALLVEYHHLFDEPAAWFGGANLLRSKLPLVVQDRVRKFRRSLAAQSPRPPS